jgi:hypothetical protein
MAIAVVHQAEVKRLILFSPVAMHGHVCMTLQILACMPVRCIRKKSIKCPYKQNDKKSTYLFIYVYLFL